MPVYPINDHVKIAEVAAKNGWSNRPVSVTGEGKIITRTHYYRDNDEIVVSYDLMEKMVRAEVVRDDGDPIQDSGRILVRMVSIIRFLERPKALPVQPYDNGPTLTHHVGHITARRQDEETREWRETGHAYQDSSASKIWRIVTSDGHGVGVIDPTMLPEGKDIAAVEAILRALF